jgi:hypothetical protein
LKKQDDAGIETGSGLFRGSEPIDEVTHRRAAPGHKKDRGGDSDKSDSDKGDDDSTDSDSGDTDGIDSGDDDDASDSDGRD